MNTSKHKRPNTEWTHENDIGVLERLREIEAMMRRLYAESLEGIREVEKRRLVGANGYTDLPHLLRQNLRITRVEARRRIRHLRISDRSIMVANAIRDGSMGPEHVEAFGNTMDTVPDYTTADQRFDAERTLVRRSQYVDAQSLRTVGRHILAKIDQDGPDSGVQSASSVGDLKRDFDYDDWTSRRYNDWDVEPPRDGHVIALPVPRPYDNHIRDHGPGYAVIRPLRSIYEQEEPARPENKPVQINVTVSLVTTEVPARTGTAKRHRPRGRHGVTATRHAITAAPTDQAEPVTHPSPRKAPKSTRRGVPRSKRRPKAQQPQPTTTKTPRTKRKNKIAASQQPKTARRKKSIRHRPTVIVTRRPRGIIVARRRRRLIEKTLRFRL